MAIEDGLLTVTREAGADLSSKQYHFGLVASDGKVDAVGSAGADATGVIQNDPSAEGQPCVLGVAGISKVVSGAGVTAGVKVQSDANGRAILAASGDHVLGQAMTGSSNNGEFIEVLLGVSNHLLV